MEDSATLGNTSPQTDSNYELTESINIKEEIDTNIVIEEHSIDVEIKTEEDDNGYQNEQLEVKDEPENSLNFRKYIESKILEEFKVQSEVDSILPITQTEEEDANVKQECLAEDALISFDFPTFNDASMDSGSVEVGSMDSNDAAALGNVETCLQEDGVSIKYENDAYDVKVPHASDIKWTSEASFSVAEKFEDLNAGIRPDVNLTKDSTELDFFNNFFNDSQVEEIVRCTNLYHQYFVQLGDIRINSRLKCWTDVTKPEIYLFLAVTMLFTRNQKLTIEEHWSTDDLLNAPIFGKLMTRNRYSSIMAMIHFTDRFTLTSRLDKVKFLIDSCRKVFKETFVPHEKLSIDASIVPFTGRLTVQQNLLNKTQRFGIKLFVLCDVETGYILDFVTYCGKETNVTIWPDLGITGSVVTSLVAKYFDCNRQLYLDNCYTSPELFLLLKQRGISACGTVRAGRNGMPKFKKLKKGEIQAFYAAPLMALKWQDKKSVHMLTTMHDAEMVPTFKERNGGVPEERPKCVDDYSRNMSSVDATDMMMSSLTCIRKTKTWFKKLAFRIFDMELMNAFFLFKTLKKGSRLQFSEYQLNVIRQLITTHKIISTASTASIKRGSLCTILPSDVIKHFPVIIPNRKSQRCKMCAASQTRRYTRYMCKECNVYLCIDPCSRTYHEK